MSKKTRVPEKYLQSELPPNVIPVKSRESVPAVAMPAGSTYVIGSYGNPSIDKWDPTFISASDGMFQVTGVRVNPRVVKSMMGIESGQDGTYPASRCRASDGEDSVPACGPMQIKLPYHAYKCSTCDVSTVKGQIELATVILGLAMRDFQLNEYQAITEVYFTNDDENGTSQKAYLNKVRADVAAMETSAGSSTAPPVPTKNPISIITGGVSNTIDFEFLGWNATGAYYEYVIGHGGTDAHQHSGIDVLVPFRTPLYIPLPGKVICVGNQGTPLWGQGCGSFNDEMGGGIGNITILFDMGLKMTLGHCNQSLVRVGDRVQAGQQVGTSGGMNAWHVHIDIAENRSGSYWLLSPVPALQKALGQTAIEPAFPWPVQWVQFAGSAKWFPLPADVKFKVFLTPIDPRVYPNGANRSGKKLTRWEGHTQHETGNRGVGTGAEMHAKWQFDGTPGHPDGHVGVHFYVDDGWVIQTLPINEQGVHSGDARNQTHTAAELCVNADRNAAKAERNAQALDAAIIGWGLSATALDDLYPHHSTSGCPAIINGRGGWKLFEQGVDRLISAGLGSGPAIPPEPVYVKAIPVPKEWDGSDWLRKDGTLFEALRRVFVVQAPDGTPALQSASLDSLPVRAKLKKGEGFESYYVVKSEGVPWFVSRFGSRILAADCGPDLDFR